MIKINEANIPDDLKDRKQWVLWRIVKRDGNDTKVPFQVNGSGAKSNDPSTWATFNQVIERYACGNWDGVGFVFSADDPFVGVDLDGCRDPNTGEIVRWAKDVIVALASYAEVSPSGTGVKLWVRGSWPYQGGHKVILSDVEKITAKTPAVEVYESVRYFAVTGHRLAGQRTISDRQEQLDALRKQFWKEPAPYVPQNEFRSQTSVIDRARKYLAKMDVAVSGQDGHGTTFKAACVLVLGFELSTSDALSLLQEWNQGCQPQWSERELRHKIDSANQQTGDRGYLRHVAPQNYHHVPMPEYSWDKAKAKRESAPEPEASDDSDIEVTLLDEAAKGYLSDVVRGNVNLLRLGLPDVDDSIGGGVEPGEMIIFAARPSHGKSMAAQQVIYQFTENGIPAMFVSEEMPARLIGKRAVQFASRVPGNQWAENATTVSSDIDRHFVSRAPCYIVENCRNVNRVVEQIRKFVLEKQVGLAVVDYAQQLAQYGKNRLDEITHVSRELKKVAVECNIPVIVLCQMGRAIESRTKFIPVMSDIKEAGQLEQDADVIIFQVWPFKIDPTQDRNEYQLFIAKNRNREILRAAVTCTFIPSRQKLVYTGAQDDYLQAFDEPSQQTRREPGTELDLPDWEFGQPTNGDF